MHAMTNTNITDDLFSPIDRKNTKIVATIGPATESEDKIAELILAGMNIDRFNTKHNEPDWHRDVIRRVRKVAQEMKVPIGILVDLQGPEIRIDLKQSPIEITQNDHLHITTAEYSTENNDILLPLNVIHGLSVGDHLITDEGACHFVIVSKNDDHLIAEALESCSLKTRKTVNTPNVVINMPSLTDRDEIFLDELKTEAPEFVGLSFVRDERDIAHLRNVLSQKNIDADVIAKIENRKAVENLESIISVSDAVMVARGDLAMEVDYEELIFWQKKIIELGRKYAKPVITATQMLLSMTEKPMPTRAEISDIAHAVYDGTDAVMLSEETTIGKYPAKCVGVQAKIVAFYEPQITDDSNANTKQFVLSPLVYSIAEKMKASQPEAEKIVVLGDSMNLVHQLSSFHFTVPILALTSSLLLSQKLTLTYGVQPMYLPNTNLADFNVDQLIEVLKEQQKLSLGERVLVIYNPNGKPENAANQPLLREVI